MKRKSLISLLLLILFLVSLWWLYKSNILEILISNRGSDTSQYKSKHLVNVDNKALNYGNIKKIGCSLAKDNNSIYLIENVTEESRYAHADDFKNGPKYFYDEEDIERGYVINGKVKDLNPDTFNILYESPQYCYVGDHQHVFRVSTDLLGTLNEMKNADPATFKVMDPDIFSRDDKSVFFYDQLVPEADPHTFIIENPDNEYASYVNDRNNIYFFNFKNKKMTHLSALDRPTYTQITLKEDHNTGKLYAKDIREIYYRDTPIKGVDYETFEIIEGAYSKDINNVYCAGVPVDEALRAKIMSNPNDKSILPKYCSNN